MKDNGIEESIYFDEPVKIVDSNIELDNTPSFQTENITDKDRLIFAKWILAVIAIIYFLSLITECIWPGNSGFESCKITLPSLATLVIGYFFGTTKS